MAEEVLFVSGDDPLGHTGWAAQRALGASTAHVYRAADDLDVADLADRHVVAHSRGAAAALLLLCRTPVRLASLVVVEPPLFQCAPRHPDAAEMRRRLAAATGSGDPQLAYHRFAAALGEAVDRALTGPELECGRRLAEVRPVWEVARPNLAALRATPVMVVSGGWSGAFDAVATQIAGAAGCEHTVLAGQGHRPQRLGEPFNEIVRRHWSRSAPTPSFSP